MTSPAVCLFLLSLLVGFCSAQAPLEPNNLVTLTIDTIGEGSGSVISINPDFVQCGEVTAAGPGPADCILKVPRNLEVNLRANPHSGSIFVGWTAGQGFNCTGPFCRVRTDGSNLTVLARFEPDTTPAIYVVRASPQPGSVLPVTAPTVFLYFNAPIIFLSLNIFCTDGHNRRVSPVPIDTPVASAFVGNVAWRVDFPPQDPVPLGATCSLVIPRRQALVPKDKEKIFGIERFQNQELFIFNPDAILAVDYQAFYEIVAPSNEVNSTVVDPASAIVAPAAILTSAVTATVEYYTTLSFPVPRTLRPRPVNAINVCAVNVRVLAGGVNLFMAAGFVVPTSTGSNRTGQLDFAQQTIYVAGRGDDAIRKVYAFKDLGANLPPQQCFFFAIEQRLSKRNVEGLTNTEDTTILIGPVNQFLIDGLAPIPSAAPTVVPPPSPPPPTSPSPSGTPAPTPAIDFFICANGCMCPITQPQHRCGSVVAATVPGCANPCSNSASPSGFVRGLLDVHTGPNDLLPGTLLRVTTSATVSELGALPKGCTFSGKRITIQFIDAAGQPTHRFAPVTLGLEYRALVFGSASDVTSSYVLLGQSGSNPRQWDNLPYSIDSSGRLFTQYTGYEELIFARCVVPPSPNPYYPGETLPRGGATSGGSTTLFADLTEADDPTYGPVPEVTAYMGNFVPTPVPLSDNPFFTDRTFRLSPASLSLPSAAMMLLALAAAVLVF